MLLKMVVISLSQGWCDRTRSRSNKDRLGPAGHIALTSTSSHTLLFKALKCDYAWITADRMEIPQALNTEYINKSLYSDQTAVWKYVKMLERTKF